MSGITFHRCRICGAIFYSLNRSAYCKECIPPVDNSATSSIKMVYNGINNMELLERKRARERARWHAKMSNPVFREKERQRSLARARAEKKYAKEEK